MEVATSDLILPLIQNNLGIGFVAEELTAPLLEEGKLVQISPGTLRFLQEKYRWSGIRVGGEAMRQISCANIWKII